MSVCLSGNKFHPGKLTYFGMFFANEKKSDVIQISTTDFNAVMCYILQATQLLNQGYYRILKSD